MLFLGLDYNCILKSSVVLGYEWSVEVDRRNANWDVESENRLLINDWSSRLSELSKKIDMQMKSTSWKTEKDVPFTSL